MRNTGNKSESLILRQRAEKLLKIKHSNSVLPRSEAEMLKLIHELEVHQIELELQNEELNESLFRANHSVMLLIDPETGDIKDANPVACRFYGWSHPILCSKNISDINVLSHSEILAEMALAKTEKRNYFIFKHRLASGEIRDVEVYSGPVSYNNSTILYSNVHDISDRKKTEEKLLKSESKYRNLVENINDVIYEVTCEGILKYVSPSVIRVLGFKPDEVLGRNITSFIHPEDRQMIIERLASLAVKNYFYLEYRYINKSGETRWVQSSTTAIVEDGKLFGGTGTLTDITDRKMAENALNDKNNLLTNLIINLQEGILLEDSDRKIALTNQQFCDMFSIPAPPEVLIGADCSGSAEESKHFFKNPEKFIADINLILTNKNAVFNHALQLVDGRYFERDYIPTYHENKYSGHLWKYRDITQRKQTEEALSASEMKYRNLVENINEVIFEVDLRGTIKYIAPSIEKIVEYSPNELIGRNLGNFVGENAEPILNRLLSLKENKISDNEYKIFTKSGHPCYIRLSTQAVFENDEFTGGSGTLIDITDRKLDEMKIQELNANLELKVAERTLQLGKSNENLKKEIDERIRVSEALVKSENNYRSVVENVHEIIFQTDAEGLWVFLNKAWEEVTGFSVKESLGELFVNYVHPDDRERNWRLFEPLICRKKDYCRHEIRYLTKAGGFRWIEVFARLALNEQNEIIGTLGTLQDITDRKQIENKLIESENLQRSLLENVGVGIAIIDPGTRIIEMANSFATLLIGENKEAIVGKRCHNYICPSAENQCPICDLGQEVDNSEKILLRFDKKEIPILKTVKRILIDGKEKLLESFVDISAQKIAEDALLLSSKKWEAMVLASPDGIGMTSLDGTVQMFSDRLIEMFGYSVEQKKEFIGTNLSDFIDPIYHPILQANISKLIENNGEHRITEYLVIKKDLSRFFIEVNSTVLNDSKGNPSSILFVERDITERKQTEELLAQIRQNYETFFNTIDDFLFVLDEQGNIIHTNNTVNNKLEYSTEELLARSVLMIHPIDRRDEAGRIVGEMLAGITDFCPVPLVTKSGNQISVETRVKHGFWDGKPVIFGVSKDVSQIKISEEKFSKAFHSNSALMAITGFEYGNYIDVNDAFLKTLNYLRSDVIGKTSTELEIFTDSEARKTVIEKLRQNEIIREIELEVRKKSGEIIIGLFSADYIFIGIEVCILTVMVDITERKKAEDTLRKAQMIADQANLAKSEFLSRMSHELRTPMNSILGFAQLLDMGELNIGQKKGVNHILKSGKHLLDLINEVLDISRIEAGKISLSLEPVQLILIIPEMLDIVRPQAGTQQLLIEFEKSSVNQLFVKSDRQRLKQILLNLLNNAIKYNNDGGSVHVKTELKSEMCTGASLIRISITDTGLGISQGDIPKLFKPFERIGAEKTKTEGTGLGLSVVKKLIEAMGGYLGVESKLGEGSTFWFELPQSESPFIIAEYTGNLAAIESKLSEKTGTILYVEDNVSNIELVEYILSSQRSGINLITKVYGRQTVNTAIELQPDLILLDLDLPDIHGSEVLEQLQAEEKTREIPVVIISADAMTKQIEKLMKTGAKNYLTKPIEVINFLRVIDEFIKG